MIDEAHHAEAPTCKKVLGDFQTKFVLSLTATTDRADSKWMLELF